MAEHTCGYCEKKLLLRGTMFFAGPDGSTSGTGEAEVVEVQGGEKHTVERCRDELHAQAQRKNEFSKALEEAYKVTGENHRQTAEAIVAHIQAEFASKDARIIIGAAIIGFCFGNIFQIAAR